MKIHYRWSYPQNFPSIGMSFAGFWWRLDDVSGFMVILS